MVSSRRGSRLSESDYLTLLESVHAIVWRADARTFRTTFATRAAEHVLGYPLESWTTEPDFWLKHLHEDDREWVLAFTSREARAGRSHDFEYRMMTADGRVVWLRNLVNVVRRKGEPAELIGVTVDVTPRKNAEAQAEVLRQELTRFARVAMVGEVAATLAHELNQPLGALCSNAETAQALLGTGAADRLEAILGEIREDAFRAGEILHRVHAFLQRRPPQKRPVCPALLIDGVLSIMRPVLAARQVECQCDVDPLLPSVTGDAVQIQQVLVNLIRNAADAAAVHGTNGRLVIRAQRAGSAVEFAVVDNGDGFDPDMLARLFEPFATSKPGGLGMGLVISRRIVEAHGGRIQVHTEPGAGTVVSFTIPIEDHQEEA